MAGILGIHPAIITFAVAMVPIIELRGALPLGVSMGLSPLTALVFSILGNLVPVPFIMLFIRRIFEWMKKKIPWLRGFVARMEAKAQSKKKLIDRGEIIGLFLLVAIPLPGTGAWTGALVAALLDIRIKRAMPAIAAGVVAAGLIVCAITYGVAGFLG